MARDSIANVVERSRRAWLEKDMWQPVLQDCYQYALPGRNLYLEASPGHLKSESTYDSTLVASVKRAANQYATELFPPGEDWAMLVPGRLWQALSTSEDEVKKIQDLLNDITKICFGLLHSSNFDTAMGEFLLDWLIATGTLLSNPGHGDQPIEFCCVPLYQLAFETGAYGKTSAVFRNFKIKARDIEPTWKKMGFTAPGGFEKLVKDKPNEPVSCMEATYLEYETYKWCYEVYIKGTFEGSSSEYHRVVEKDYEVCPWIVTHYSKAAGESLGRGPVMDALPDARVLNKAKELTLKAGSLAIFPPMMVIDDGVINFSTVKLTPGAPIPVARNDGALGPSIKPLVTGENFDVSDIIISDHQAIVRRTMNDDQLPQQNGAVRSATEYMARMRDGQRNSAPRARLLTDFFRPLFQILIERAKELNLLTAIFQKHGIDADKIKVDGMAADVAITSPLFQSRNLDRLDALSAGLQLALGLGLEVTAIAVKVEDLPREIWKCLSLPSEYLRTEEERAKMQQDIASIVAAQQAPAA